MGKREIVLTIKNAIWQGSSTQIEQLIDQNCLGTLTNFCNDEKADFEAIRDIMLSMERVISIGNGRSMAIDSLAKTQLTSHIGHLLKSFDGPSKATRVIREEMLFTDVGSAVSSTETIVRTALA